MNYQIVMAQLPLVREHTETKCRTAQDVTLMCADMATLAQESVQIITLDAKNNVINRHMITLGLIDESLIHPREVFRQAILDFAKAIVIVHNHPSGDSMPSATDIRRTKQMVEAGKIIEIPVLDHVIIGRNAGGSPTFTSMREQGIVQWSTEAERVVGNSGGSHE
jgi:DNA repair protein RadC